MLGRDAWGSTLGIVGLGAIAQAVVRRAKGFSMEVVDITLMPNVPTTGTLVPTNK